ncbi:MAG: hypothetical protein QNJ68_14240 [Microcoleaceae cyanobacterium MO_207.B10]|nr:hypothetical protein [Microcoleaceae cyanobacterium MO_207.B10]
MKVWIEAKLLILVVVLSQRWLKTRALRKGSVVWENQSMLWVYT